MLVAMRRIEIVAPRRQADVLLRALHRVGSVQLVPFEPRSGLEAAVFSAAARSPVRRAEAALEEVAALAEALGPTSARVEQVEELWPLESVALRARVEALAPLRARVAELLAQHAHLESEETRLTGYRRILEALRPVVDRVPSLPGFGSTAIVVRARYRAVLGLVRSELEALTDGRCEMVASDISGERVAALVVYPLTHAERVRALLGGRDLEELTLPEELAGLPFPQLGARLTERESKASADRRAVDAELDTLGDQHGPSLAALRLVLQDRVAEEQALADAGTSDHLLLLCGWVPIARLPSLRERLATDVGPEVCVEEIALDRDEQERAPVAIQNPPLFQAFAPLASFVTLPRYGTIDPTPFLAVTFPIFVGLMVGDVAYGLVLLGVLLLARRRWRRSPLMATATPIVTLVGLSTIVFGVLYGEWLGNAGQTVFGIRPVLLDRQEAMITFLLVAIAIGVGQVGIGLVLGVINAGAQGLRHELAGRLALFGVLVAILLGLGALLGLIPPSGGHVALALLAAALAVLIASLGMAGPIEAIGMLSNILSYTRLMAIGMASVMLALVANRLGGIAGNVVVGLLVAALLHSMNVVLGFFDATVQGLRLHYVEFFTKFVAPGGTHYQPFTCVLGRLSEEATPRDPASQAFLKGAG